MNTYLEYQVHKLDTESLLEKGEFIESKRSLKEWIEDKNNFPKFLNL